MKISKWFNFDWLTKSEERKQLQAEIAAFKEKELREKIRDEVITELVKSAPLHICEIKPYKNLYFSGNNITIVLNDGETLMAECDVLQYERVKNAKTKEELIAILYPPKVEEEYTISKNDLAILEVNDDFDVQGTQVFLKPCRLPLPEIVKASFIELLEKKLAFSSKFHYSIEDNFDEQDLDKEYESLKMFWYKLSTSSLEKCRESVLTFCKNNDVKISPLGNIISYRNVVSWENPEKNHLLQDFVETKYRTITKIWKKKASDYSIYYNSDYLVKNYKIVKNNIINKDNFQSQNNVVVGNLADLKAQGCDNQEQWYTSKHNSGKYVFQIGDVYKMEGEEPDANVGNCHSGGLHAGNVNFSFSGYGDTKVVCLVNPAKNIYVPDSDSGKFRCSEMKIACLNPNEYGVHIDEDLIKQADEEYNDYTIEQLQEAVKQKSFVSLCVQQNAPEMTLPNLQEIVNILNQKTIKF